MVIFVGKELGYFCKNEIKIKIECLGRLANIFFKWFFYFKKQAERKKRKRKPNLYYKNKFDLIYFLFKKYENMRQILKNNNYF